MLRWAPPDICLQGEKGRGPPQSADALGSGGLPHMFVRQELRLWAKSISHAWLRLKAGQKRLSDSGPWVDQESPTE